MKPTYYCKTVFTVLFLLISTNLFCQQKEIEITKSYQKTVPNGKVWYLSNSNLHTVVLSNGSFESGTACNAALHSNPSYLYGIVCYDTITQSSHIPKIFGFTIKDSPTWLHDNVYTIKPHYLIKNNLDDVVLKNSLIWVYKPDEIVFYPGMRLQTSACINNLIIYERNMTVRDQNVLGAAKNKRLADEQTLQRQRLSYEQGQQRQKLAKYNNMSSVYNIKDVSNPRLLFKNLRFDSACVTIGRTLKIATGGDLKKYHQYFDNNNPLQIPIHVKWDSTGRVISYQINSEQHLNNLTLDSTLALDTFPIAKHIASRRCLFEAELTFTIAFKEKPNGTYYIKKGSKDYKFINNRYPEEEPQILEKLKTITLGDNGFYRVNYSKITLTVSFYPYGYDYFERAKGENVQIVEDSYADIMKIDRSDLPGKRF